MELSDADRECRSDAADAEQEDWKEHTFQIGDSINWCMVEYARGGTFGPNVLITMHNYGFDIGDDEVQYLDALIDALTEARTWCFGEREDA